DPEFIRLGPFVRSLATLLQKTEVFLRHGMSDDVLAQIGKGELDVGYYIDAAPPESIASGIMPERHIDDGKFRLVPLTSYNYRITRKRNFVIADKVTVTCDLSFACLTSRRHESVISHAFSAMQAVWDLNPAATVPAPISAARSRKTVRR